jgi:hypothetical protein
VPNQRAKNKMFLGLWLPKPLLKKLKRKAKDSNLTLSGYVISVILGVLNASQD